MEEFWIYHEQQESMLCGVHCLNNLLQRIQFSAVDLANYAEEMHERERAFMTENGCETQEALQFIAQDNHNVDEYGNFSIQVLKSALEGQNGIQLVCWKPNGPADAQDICDFDGFICNREDHWFAIRKIGGNYWNLNSCNKKPTAISPFYLSAFLAQLCADGYSVFIAQGELPSPYREPIIGLSSKQKFFNMSALLARGGGKTSDGGSKNKSMISDILNLAKPKAAAVVQSNDSDDDDMKMAMAMSLSDGKDEGFSFLMSDLNPLDVDAAYEEIFKREDALPVPVEIARVHILMNGLDFQYDFPVNFSLLGLYVFADGLLKERNSNDFKFQLLLHDRIIGSGLHDLKGLLLGEVGIVSNSNIQVKVLL